MYNIDYSIPIHVHFIGIGGISMSGLAHILHNRGFRISGSDMRSSDITRRLEDEGINILYNHSDVNLDPPPDLVVYTAAIKDSNPEYRYAQEHKIPMLSRAELLGQIMNNYNYSLSVAGTHGKTTTSTMLSEILLEANLDPTLSLGGIMASINSNTKIGLSDIFLTEACEYCDSFLTLKPYVSAILNIEEDHMDYFNDLSAIYSSFQSYAKNTREDGHLIINGDIPNLDIITSNLKCNVITYGTNDNNDYHLTASHIDNSGLQCVTISTPSGTHKYKLHALGMHNITNSIAAIAMARCLNISDKDINNALLQFHGSLRRFQIKGKIGNITIVDDYAHHPTEIKATLSAARDYPHERIWCIFQPHTYTRTKAFYNDFVHALSMADIVVLADIYAARESDTLGINSKDLCESIRNNGCECYYFSTFDEIENYFLEKSINGDLLITMGAGDIVKVGEELLGI